MSSGQRTNRSAAARMLLGGLGVVLLTAGGLKLRLMTSSGDQIERGFGWELSGGIIEFELLLGVWLVLGPAGRWTWLLTLTLFAMFLAVALHRTTAGADTCGCFGRVRVHPAYTATLDASAVLALAAFGTPAAPASGRRLGRVRIGLLGAGWSGALIVGIWGMSRAADSAGDGLPVSDGVTNLEPQNWLGKPFPLDRYIDIPANLMSGHWVVVLYRWDCEHCRAAMPGYEAMAKRSKNDPSLARVALIEVPPFAPPGQWIVHADCGAALGRLSGSREWFVQTPCRIEIREGRVVGRVEGT